jgi:hypothetical protein
MKVLVATGRTLGDRMDGSSFCMPGELLRVTVLSASGQVAVA